jgi:hypothetical protein
MALHEFCARRSFPDQDLLRAIADLLDVSVGIIDPPPMPHLAEPALETIELARRVIDDIETRVRQVSGNLTPAG